MAKGVRLKDKDGPVYPCPFFPVGSIYMSVNSTNPSTYFGGTWVEIQGRFLLGRSSSYTAGSQGGEASHTLTSNEMPSHTHSMASGGAHTHYLDYRDVFRIDAGGRGLNGYGKTGNRNDTSMTNSAGSHAHTINAAGGGAAHNNMPPYLAVYIWKRTA